MPIIILFYFSILILKKRWVGGMKGKQLKKLTAYLFFEVAGWFLGFALNKLLFILIYSFVSTLSYYFITRENCIKFYSVIAQT